MAVDRGHGRVTINGQLLVSACSLHTEDAWQEIVFDIFTPRQFRDNPGLTEKPFSVRLQNCRLEKEKGGEWQSVTITFDGEPEPGHDSLFSVNGDAKGISLKVTDLLGHTAIPGVEMDAIPLKEDENKLDYILSLVPNGDEFTEGNWSGVIRFMVAYQ